MKGHDINDRIIYNTLTGALHMMPTDQAPPPRIQFSTLKDRPTLTVADFIVV